MQEINIIPAPSELKMGKGKFSLQEEIKIICPKEITSIATIFTNYFHGHIKFTVSTESSTADEGIVLQLSSEKEIGEEGYFLDVQPKTITIKSGTAQGIFYGLQTLRQLIPASYEDKNAKSFALNEIPCCAITDFPRFSWRGFMLDCCRHFWPVSFIKRTLDLLAFQKFNVFHWHLTEDQGWRIEIKKYPLLTEIGSKRIGSQEGYRKDKKHDSIPHGGYYTQDDIKEIVAYAKERFIKVIPEIEMPGHSQAALVAYPELACTSGAPPFKVGTQWGVYRDVYCGGKDSVLKFNQDILDEVMDLFPSEIIHTGGDEVPKDRWKECSDCQTKIKSEGLKDEHALQCYFTNKISKYLADHGKRLMGWNEILDPDLAPNAICHFWTGKFDPIIAEIKNGRDIVVSKSSHLYLDHTYKHSSLSKYYKFEPVPDEVSPQYHGKVLGVESPLWCEVIFRQRKNFPDYTKYPEKIADYQMWPRLNALSEIGWTKKENKDVGSFFKRFDFLKERLSILGVNLPEFKDYEPSFFKRLILKRSMK